ncbi:glycosyltransferase [Kitasatospora sp. NBC_01287]|uniref:glycosyltransferase n=1 Tax=Kitasatospora sp. NBC_01287 TaxID=2903573 RepID=UPI0022572B92|nr:glycosyltransferase [Kitasatospora sp. NBC_01287]MCX4746098.1 glycosyltransferase [Kitasatospora sp. NBC_01287]
MKVLHVITGLAAGGAERQLLLTVRHLPPSVRCEVAVLTNPGSVAAELRADGVPVHDLAMRGNRDLAVLPRLVRLIRRGQYDVVHTHLYRAGLYGRLAARLAGVRAVLATEHSLHAGTIEGRPVSAGVKSLYLAAERLGVTTVAVSGQVAHTLADWGVPRRRVAVLPNGIETRDPAGPWARRTETRRGLGLAADAFVVGGVGRLVPGKRFEVLLQALTVLPRAVLLLVGEGPQRAELAERARTLGVGSRLLLVGERADVPELLGAMDVLAAPSVEETFGLAVLEGLAAGLPVLHSGCPALEELPAEAAPGARKLPSTVAAYQEALLALGPAPLGVPLPRPPAVAHYDIVRTAGRLGELYERLGRAPVALPTGRES